MPHGRDLGLEPLARVVDSPRAKRRESKPPSLVEAKCLEVVVGRDEPDPLAVGDLGAQRFQKRRSDAPVLLDCDDESQFAVPAVAMKCQKPHRSVLSFCDEPW